MTYVAPLVTSDNDFIQPHPHNAQFPLPDTMGLIGGQGIDLQGPSMGPFRL